MALFSEPSARGLAVALVSVAIIVVAAAFFWRRMRAEFAWEKGLARPVVLDGIRSAIHVYRCRSGAWPSAKADLRGRIRVEERYLKHVGDWNIKLVAASRDGETARYSILVKDTWEDWDTDADAAHAAMGGARERRSRSKFIQHAPHSHGQG